MSLQNSNSDGDGGGLDGNLLYFVERNLILPSIVKLRRPRASLLKVA
jgi:hypothetical protein